jgi:FkbM family methyltransferase
MGHLRNVNPLEPLVTNYRKFFGDTANIIFDVGTRDGHDAFFMEFILNSTYEYAIDANPEAIKATQKNYPHMAVIHTAISDYDGTTSFQQVFHEREDYVGCSSIYAQKLVEQEDFKGNVTTIEVPVKKMTTLLSELNLLDTIIDVIKVDVEGYTWEFLMGLEDKINNVKCFHLETEQNATHPNHKNSKMIKEYMTRNGFYLADVSYEWGWEIEDQVWVNKALAINNTECWI